MWELLTALLFGLIPFAIFAGMIYVIVRRGLQMKQLLADGVETTGLVVRQAKHSSSRSGMRHRYLRYEYHDSLGRAHTHQSLVPDDVWDAHMEGGSIDVVYSQRRPAVSAPKYLVEQVRPKAQRDST